MRSKRHAPRSVADHVLGNPVGRIRLLDVVETPVLGHSAELDGNAIGRRLVTDVIEDDFRAPASIQHDACPVRRAGGGGQPEWAPATRRHRDTGGSVSRSADGQAARRGNPPELTGPLLPAPDTHRAGWTQ